MPSYDKIIFLDADLVVLDDIANLLKLSDNDSMINAVRDYEGIANCYNNNYERTKYRISEIGISDFEKYFISGVLVMNPRLFNEKFSAKELLDFAISKNWKQLDQDLLNFLCKDSVNILGAEWDFVEDIYGIYHSMPKHLFDEYLASETNPKIIHYSAKRKPWINISSKYNIPFWEIANETNFADELKIKINND